MSPGIARLWTGISCVGTLVTIAAVMLIFDFPNAVFGTATGGGFDEFMSLLVFFTGAAGLLMPFDLIGGILIPTAFENQAPKFRLWLRHWLRSVGLQILFYSLSFFLYLQMGREAGVSGLIAIFVAIQIALIASQELIWRIMTAQLAPVKGHRESVFVPHLDQRFAGGITGLPGLESILIPSAWRTRLTPSQLMVIVKRRIAARDSGGRLRGIVWAMLWNTVSFSTAILLNGWVVGSVADLVTVFLWFLLLSFVGLLVLPSLNRKSVFALDHYLAARVNSVDLREAICEIDQLTEQDPTRSASAESVFQPIPCPERRLLSLTKEGSQHVPAWNVARTTLFLSWAFGGPLARAVHCNVGRPELWAILPTD